MRQPPSQATHRAPGMVPLRARSMLFTLFGDYAYPERRDVPLGGLVEIGQALGLSEVAVRSAVARLAREGWMAARRRTGRARYGLSAAGRRLIEEGTQRIYRPRSRAWSGDWCLLTYSIPESRRSERDRIRKQLAWLGFGALSGGAYVSSRDGVARDAIALLRRHRLLGFARVFSAKLEGPGEDDALVAQCWGLDAVARSYEAFIRHYEPLHRRDRALVGKHKLDDAAAFATRFSLTHDFRRFPFVDPDLPPRLLPTAWAGARARRLFEAHNRLLRAGAFRFFDSVAGHDG